MPEPSPNVTSRCRPKTPGNGAGHLIKSGAPCVGVPKLRQAAGLIVGFAGGPLIFEPLSKASGLTSAGALECPAASVSYVYTDGHLAHRRPSGHAVGVPAPGRVGHVAIVLGVLVPGERITAIVVVGVAWSWWALR